MKVYLLFMPLPIEKGRLKQVFRRPLSFKVYFQTKSAWLRLPRRTMVYLPKRLCASVSR